MPSNYEEVRKLANAHSYSSFTKLQEQAFRSEDCYDKKKDLFIIGETSSGKTLIPLLLYQYSLEKAAAEIKEYPKMLFIVPYRALAAQKKKEMTSFFEGWNLTIVQSTGEFRQDDDLIQRAQVHIAVVISEKVYKYAARDVSFLSQYDYLVMDEIGLINNPERGIRLDFILAWAKYQRNRLHKPRIIALGTPFYDWNAYIKNYQFTAVIADKRPVKLQETQIVYDNTGILSVEGDCSFLYPVRRIPQKRFEILKQKYETPGATCPLINDELCSYVDPCRSDRSRVCTRAGKPCPFQVKIITEEVKSTYHQILLDICREHLLSNHQILIFVNDRSAVMELCGLLYRGLKQYLGEVQSVEKCRQTLLKTCGLETDDLFGIMEYETDQNAVEDYYKAFASGIGFHSAALPNELRTYVEDKLLESREMRIVCSTETLAFGVNSTVDVVIVADLIKHDGSEVRPLSLNEYNNYVGRAGRLRPDMPASDIKGYVYTLINGKRASNWQTIKEEGSHPEKLYSLFHTDDGQFMPFFLINILPESSADSLTLEQIVTSISSIPQNSMVSDQELLKKIEQSILFLKDQELVAEPNLLPQSRLHGRRTQDTQKYCLTDFGKQMRGYIIGRDDFLELMSAIEEYVSGVFLTPNKAHFLYRLLSTGHAESGLTSVFRDSETRISTQMACDSVKHYSDCETDAFEWLEYDVNIRILYILGALLAWTEGESPKFLYREYGIHYALIHKLAEQIAYLIEIGCEILPTQMLKIYQKKRDIYQRMQIDAKKFAEAIEEKKAQMQKLFISVYYGINTTITDLILEELQKLPSSARVEELIGVFSLTRINPISARKLRALIIRYKFFENPPKVDMTNVELRNNFLDQRRQYQKDVAQWGEEITGIFRDRFNDIFVDKKGGATS